MLPCTKIKLKHITRGDTSSTSLIWLVFCAFVGFNNLFPLTGFVFEFFGVTFKTTFCTSELVIILSLFRIVLIDQTRYIFEVIPVVRVYTAWLCWPFHSFLQGLWCLSFSTDHLIDFNLVYLFKTSFLSLFFGHSSGYQIFKCLIL